MARRTYVTEGNYSNYNDHEGGYAYEPEQRVKWYVVETTTVERVRGPAVGYTKYSGAPLRHEHLKKYMPKYAPKDHHEGYEVNYGSSYENSSLPRYNEVENLMADFLNKIQIEASRPPNKYRPTSPNKYRHTSPSKYRTTSPGKYWHTSPGKYRHTSPSKFRITSPGTYRHTSPSKYRHTSPDKYRRTSPSKYRPTSPRLMSPNKYRHTSPTHNYPSKEAHITFPSPNMHRPTSPTKYRPTSPTKYRPTSPTKYRPTSPTHTYPSKEEHMIRAQKFPGMNKYRPTSPTQSFPSKEGQRIRTQQLSSPNKHRPSSPSPERGRHIRLGNFPGPSMHWHGVGLPTTRHPLTAPTNDINEALGFLVESVNYSSRAQSYEHERGYTRHAFGGATTQPYSRSNMIDSQ
ncbi:hypothetical protein L1987_16385 [Smallanthus sonchifolius]|uniref:Uncharacterized protein n=1 Tax=Smallanthus sonchifolius TaxID=185202 RepID=A0ACB9J8K4_9ASTR|nr:hypothetical protein L1987_16385 [Smallanthus sonchifolius]